jgi:hypothetical protein
MRRRKKKEAALKFKDSLIQSNTQLMSAACAAA